MANKAAHYYNGTTWTQLPSAGLTTADITIQAGYSQYAANMFTTVKDSKDNLYILCSYVPGNTVYPKLIKIDKNGNKTISTSNNDIQHNDGNFKLCPILSRDENRVFFVYRNLNLSDTQIGYIDISNLSSSFNINVWGTSGSGQSLIAIYQDLYI